MTKIEHQNFLKTNNLQVKLLLQPIQEKIEVFNRMYKLLEKVSDCEKGELIEELEALDLEISEDIEEEYADRLEYNDIIPVKTSEKKETELVKPLNVKKQPKKITDESILDELVKMGRTNDIGRSTFFDLGIKTVLGWTTIVGKYKIKRTSAFTYRYKIELN